MSFPLMPITSPGFELLTLAQVISAIKTIASRNQLITKTSIAQGFENNAGAGPFAEGFSSTYQASTSVSGTITYPQSTMNLFSRWSTFLTVNEGNSPGTTVVSVNGGAYSATDETVLYNKTTGVGSNFKLCLFQAPIGFGNLRSVNVTFNKGTGGGTNCQQVYVLPGKWGGITQSYYAGGSGAGTGHSSTSLSVTTNDVVFIKGGLSRADTGVPAIGHGGPANTRIIETQENYNSTAKNMALHVMDAAGTFTSDTGYIGVTSGGGGRGGGTTTYYYYSNLAQSLRFISP